MWGGNNSDYQLLVINSFMLFVAMKLEGLTLPTSKLTLLPNYEISQIQNFVYERRSI
jgi:hypothetical protein